jgi:hypothetical protein
MAITILEYTFLSILSERNVFPTNPQVLELGEQHWHGDISIELLESDISNRVKDLVKKQELLDNLNCLSEVKDKKKNFDLAKVAYKLFLNYSTVSAIDLHGTDDAFKFDLNEPIKMEHLFDIVINCGTGEHVFNIYQFFKTIHEVTAPDGIMIHVMPFLGWTDHGFFNLQPTLYWDLAQYNNYEVVCFTYQSDANTLTEVSDRAGVMDSMEALARKGNPVISSNIYLAFKKSNSSKPFQIPMQGFFQVSKEQYWDMMIDDSLISGLPTKDKNYLAKELNLREVNLIIFPDWNQSEEQTFAQIGDVVRVIGTHSECKKITLLIVLEDVSDDSELSPDIILSTIAMNCLSDEISIKDEELEISVIQDLNENEWNTLLSKISYRVILPIENSELISILSSKNKFKSCHLSAVRLIK